MPQARDARGRFASGGGGGKKSSDHNTYKKQEKAYHKRRGIGPTDYSPTVSFGVGRKRGSTQGGYARRGIYANAMKRDQEAGIDMRPEYTGVRTGAFANTKAVKTPAGRSRKVRVKKGGS